ncbi:MEDS domain-containing protein, partial [Peribacillus acanthi]|uniref:MEDS domain-containing protein n=1 Tax=Peribacillus acanthi TaxID=2171554 RepID=UPI00196BA956
MGEKITVQTRKLETTPGGHIFYEYTNLETYITNTVSYIINGIENGDHVIIIENDFIFPRIQRELEKELCREDLAKVHRVNNFDFYCFGGNFNKETVISYYKKYVNPFLENHISIRTWAHV